MKKNQLFTIRVALTVALGGFLMGFDASVISGVVKFIEPQFDLTKIQLGWSVSSLTLMATLACYLNALSGKGVHVVTVNDYLAGRDAAWMRPIYHALDMKVGVVVPGMTHDAKRAAYACEVVYATNNELGFDYLRDNMAFTVDQKVQRDHSFAIVDEVDSILIDEARTPLIISGPAEETPQLYVRINQLIPSLEVAETPEEGSEVIPEGDFTIDEKARSAVLTEEGVANAESILKVDNLYDPKHIELLHHINQAVKAHSLFKRDVDYIIKFKLLGSICFGGCLVLSCY